MKNITFEVSDADFERFRNLLSKMRSKNALLEDILNHYEDLYNTANLNHIVKKKYYVPD